MNITNIKELNVKGITEEDWQRYHVQDYLTDLQPTDVETIQQGEMVNLLSHPAAAGRLLLCSSCVCVVYTANAHTHLHTGWICTPHCDS